MITLTVSEILRLHQKLLDATGGLSGTRDLGLLESAVYSANQVFGEEEAYPTVEQRAARLAYGPRSPPVPRHSPHCSCRICRSWQGSA